MTAYHADAPDEGREILHWDEVGLAARELATTIVESGFTPDVVLAVARGGLLPAGALTYALGVKLTDTINVEFYTDIEKTLPDPILLAPMLDTSSISGKRVLVVDDVADSGRTLNLVIELIERFGADVRSAVLYSKPTSTIEPDFVWRHTDRWIVFPWSAEPPVTPVATTE